MYIVGDVYLFTKQNAPKRKERKICVFSVVSQMFTRSAQSDY